MLPDDRREVSVTSAVADLWDWLSRWMDEGGGVHGYVVHHHRDNLRVLAPDTWTQSACILGCLNLFRATGENQWIARARTLADYLASTYIPSIHVFANSNHEHKPLGKPEVISNALPSYALLETSRESRGAGLDSSKYLEVADDNVVHYILTGWDEKVGAIASLDQGRNHFVLNMNGFSALAIMNLAAAKEGRTGLSSKVDRISDFISKNQINSGPRKGGFPYRAGAENSISLYSLMTVYSLQRLSEATGRRFEPVVTAAAKHLVSLFEPRYGLIAHLDAKAPPYWVPDTFMLYLVMRKAAESGTNIEPIEIERALRMQYRSGGFPLSIGFTDLFDPTLLPARVKIRRWRDVLPTPNWNSWAFWLLSESMDTGSTLPSPRTEYPQEIESDREEWEGGYIISDDGESTRFRNPDGTIAGLFDKKKDTAVVCNIAERNEAFRLRKRLERYPSPLRRAILASAKFFG
jgi:hypothetical protein